jgi:hypothetical protein
MRSLSDEVLLQILECLDAAALERLGTCSKQLYVMARHQPLWKQLTVDAFSSGFDFCTNWRTTWQRETARAAGRFCEGSQAPAPLRVNGVYSDLLFQHWLCSSMYISPQWLRVSNIDKVHADEMSAASFMERYERPGIPCVIQGVCDRWPAFTKWYRTLCNQRCAPASVLPSPDRTDDYLSAAASDAKFRGGAADLTMQQFLSYRSRYSEEAPLILFDKRFCERAPALAADFTVPQFFSQDLFNVLGPLRPDYRWLIIAAARSGSFFHKVRPFTPQNREHLTLHPLGPQRYERMERCVLLHIWGMVWDRQRFKPLSLTYLQPVFAVARSGSCCRRTSPPPVYTRAMTAVK